jgi:hypothetical protein
MIRKGIEWTVRFGGIGMKRTVNIEDQRGFVELEIGQGDFCCRYMSRQ